MQWCVFCIYILSIVCVYCQSPWGVSLFGGVGEHTRDGSDLYMEMKELWAMYVVCAVSVLHFVYCVCIVCILCIMCVLCFFCVAHVGFWRVFCVVRLCYLQCICFMYVCVQCILGIACVLFNFCIVCVAHCYFVLIVHVLCL